MDKSRNTNCNGTPLRIRNKESAPDLSVWTSAIAFAWFAPVTSRILVGPPATAHGVTVAWYTIAAAALALTCAAMRDQWHRYSGSIMRR